MITTRTTPIVSPVLIGRAHQLAALERLIDEARQSRGQVALIAGEAGIGKSRLILETKARAADQGFSVLQGHCFAPDRVLPFAPLIDLLHTWCANEPPMRSCAHWAQPPPRWSGYCLSCGRSCPMPCRRYQTRRSRRNGAAFRR